MTSDRHLACATIRTHTRDLEHEVMDMGRDGAQFMDTPVEKTRRTSNPARAALQTPHLSTSQTTITHDVEHPTLVDMLD